MISLGLTIGIGILMLSPMECADKLGNYAIDKKKVTVSGFSSGGTMAMQFHIINSAILSGAGIFSGSPYLCGGDFFTCLVSPEMIDVESLVKQANELSDAGDIYDVKNLEGQKVFIYHGQLDTSVRPGNGLKIQEMYSRFHADVSTNLSIPAEHGMPTNFFGATCGESVAASPFISNCNYDGAFEMLNHLYNRSLRRPENYGWHSFPGELIEFDQQEFFHSDGATGMDSIGYLYVPSNCLHGGLKCSLHIVFHGCSQNSENIGPLFVVKSGYLEVAEVNDIITIFPQTSGSTGNSGGCWDTWGYTNNRYGTLSGEQNEVLVSILDRILGISTV